MVAVSVWYNVGSTETGRPHRLCPLFDTSVKGPKTAGEYFEYTGRWGHDLTAPLFDRTNYFRPFRGRADRALSSKDGWATSRLTDAPKISTTRSASDRTKKAQGDNERRLVEYAQLEALIVPRAHPIAIDDGLDGDLSAATSIPRSGPENYGRTTRCGEGGDMTSRSAAAWSSAISGRYRVGRQRAGSGSSDIRGSGPKVMRERVAYTRLYRNGWSPALRTRHRALSVGRTVIGGSPARARQHLGVAADRGA